MKSNFKNAIFSLLLVSSSFTFSSFASLSGDVPSATHPTLASDALKDLKDGNERFYTGKSIVVGIDTATIRSLASGQQPKAVIVGCSDSRVAPELIFNQGLGDLFVIRTAGEVMSDFEIGSVEYATEHLHSRLIVVMGHTSCGAVGVMLEHSHDDDVPGHIASIVNALKNEPTMLEVLNAADDNDIITLSDKAILANVEHGVKQLRHSVPILAEMYEKGEINIIGAIYDIATGKVEFYNF